IDHRRHTAALIRDEVRGVSQATQVVLLQDQEATLSLGSGTMRMYGFGDSHSPKISFACSSDTEPEMMTLSPGFHCAGVDTCLVAVNCSESITRRTSSKLRPVDMG